MKVMKVWTAGLSVVFVPARTFRRRLGHPEAGPALLACNYDQTAHLLHRWFLGDHIPYGKSLRMTIEGPRHPVTT